MRASWIAAVNAFLFDIFYCVLLLQYIQAPAYLWVLWITSLINYLMLGILKALEED